MAFSNWIRLYTITFTNYTPTNTYMYTHTHTHKHTHTRWIYINKPTWHDVASVQGTLPQLAPWISEEAEGIWDRAGLSRTFWPSPEAGLETFMWEVPFWYPQKRSIISPREKGQNLNGQTLLSFCSWLPFAHIFFGPFTVSRTLCSTSNLVWKH